MGKKDQEFAETQDTYVGSRRGFPRYSKNFNGKGNRKFATFRVPENKRTHGNRFSTNIAGGEERSD